MKLSYQPNRKMIKTIENKDKAQEAMDVQDSIEDIEEIVQSLSQDVEFLRSCRFMDYSILFAIRRLS